MTALDHPTLIALLNASCRVGVEFGDWCLEPSAPRSTAIGHLQVRDRAAVGTVLEALLAAGAGLDVDVGPSGEDPDGRWSLWVRAYPLDRAI